MLNLEELEKKILDFWEKNRIFQKSLEKTKNGKPFTFYDGPPFATGFPHYGHILASTIKDLIPRYQTMKGRFVRRRWGWDCHGLPIEEMVERHLGISGKKQIEDVGIEKFNRTCREKVLEFVEEWGKMVRRIARWVDFDNSYKTMDRDYMESVWWAFKQIYDKGLVYEGRKVLMYCPRCETPVSNFEVAMDNSYKDVAEEAVTVKFKIKNPDFNAAHFLAWTTTPWTLPGNVALAVGEGIDYVLASFGGESFILAKDRLSVLGGEYRVEKEFKGNDLAGLEYEPLFDPLPFGKGEERARAFKVYPADFVSTEEGTGIVHTAVVYGEEDYELGQKVGLPVVPMLDDKGFFNDKAPEFLRGKYFKDADPVIIGDLEKRGLLFRNEKIIHSYPHCWRCGNMLFYNAIPAWFINIQKIKKGLIDSNIREINWFPQHLKRGRYEKSVESAPDWNISRNRYWGNPIPIWKCDRGCPPIVVGSVKELGVSTNTFYFARHGEGRQNILRINSCWPEPDVFDLTEEGIRQAEKMAAVVKEWGGVDLIYASDLLRAKRTAEIAAKILGAPVTFDDRLREYNVGEFNGKSCEDFENAFPPAKRWTHAPAGGETWTELQKKVISFVKETDEKFRNKKILIISHGDPLWLIQKHYGSELGYPGYAEPFEISVGIDDLHRPAIDEVVLKCPRCGGEARRIREIFDSWVEAGSMPFAEYHYPFDQKDVFESRFPAQFVAEYIAQTRAWFYVMHVVAYALFLKAPFENVITTGTILAEDGSKMSKSKGNFPDPWEVINKYGVDALRFYLMNSVVMQADNLNFDEREVQNVYRRVVLILWNVFNYYQTYAAEAKYVPPPDGLARKPVKILDRWIVARTRELINGVTKNLDNYDTVLTARLIFDYIGDLSSWYLRRSRGRREAEFFTVLRYCLISISKIAAPFMPYISEEIYRTLSLEGDPPSVHLADWPAAEDLNEEDRNLLRDMATIREAASLGQAMRKALNIPVRQPLPRLAFFSKEEMIPSAELMQILLDELNVKKFDPTLSGLGSAEGLGGESKKRANVKVLAGTARVLNLYLDTSVSEDLFREGLIRALERAIQELRKKRGFKVGEMAILAYETEDADVKKALEVFNREKTYISDIKAGPGEEVNINGRILKLGLERI